MEFLLCNHDIIQPNINTGFCVVVKIDLCLFKTIAERNQAGPSRKSSKLFLRYFLHNTIEFMSANFHTVLAGVTVALIPIFLLFLFLRRHINSAMTAGAMVG